MSHIFISHSHVDKPFVARLAQDLRTFHHHDVWVDEGEIKVGESFLEKIRVAIRRVDYVIAVISDASVGSEWVRLELDIAMNRELDEGRVVVLPLRLTSAPLPSFLRGKVYADFTADSDYPKALLKLLAAVATPPSRPTSEGAQTQRQPSGQCRIRIPADTVGVFTWLNTVVTGSNIRQLAGRERHAECQFWDKDAFEGSLSACMYFLHLAGTVLLPYVPDASPRVGAVSSIMGIHVLDLWDSGRLPVGQPDPRADRIDHYDREWLNSGLRPNREVGAALLRWCPARDSKNFYLGWHTFAVFFSALSRDAIERNAVADTMHYLRLVVEHALGHLAQYEQAHDHGSYTFWTIVRVHIANIVSGRRTTPPLVVEDEARLWAELDTALELTDDTKTGWRKSAREGALEGDVVKRAWLGLRARFEFSGEAGDELTVRVARRA